MERAKHSFYILHVWNAPLTASVCVLLGHLNSFRARVMNVGCVARGIFEVSFMKTKYLVKSRRPFQNSLCSRTAVGKAFVAAMIQKVMF